MEKIEREVVWINGCAYLPLPREVWHTLGIEKEVKPKLNLLLDISKHGDFLGVWNPEKQAEDRKKRNGE